MEDQLLIKTLQLDNYLKGCFYKKPLGEIFSVQNRDRLKIDLTQFLRKEFENGDLKSKHQNTSTTDYKPIDWYENIADNIINRMIQYFEVIRGQTERDL